MIANRVTKIIQVGGGAAVLAWFLAASVHAQNVGIGYTAPVSKLSVNGNLAVGINAVAPGNGALINGLTCIGTTTPDPGATGANSPFLTVASSGNANITLSPSTSAPSIRAGIFFGDNTYLECTDTSTNGNKDLTLFNVATQTNVLVLSAGTPGSPSLGGFVGIVNPNPVVPLDVREAVSANFGAGEETNFYFGNPVLAANPALAYLTQNLNFPAQTFPTVSAYFSGGVISGNQIMSFNGTVTASDSRLKNIIGKSDAAKDLDTLKKIEITDYTMKDTVRFGNEPFKKVVAQQVEQVYPTAVKQVGFKGLTYMPDIYALSSKVENTQEGTAITISKAHGLRVGDSVRLMTTRNVELDFDVTKVIDANTFVVKTNAATKLGDKVFVYGKFCPDMKGVDYEAITTLNVSATQELAKKVEILEQQNSDLQDQNKRLTAVEEKEKQELAIITEQGAQIAALRTENEQLGAMASKIETLEKTLTTMQEKENSGVRTVALEQ